ncbi:MAG: TrkH family potassium uptake protein [Acidimicrobiia bacterium]|nr:TrkH family potassium uptake protein [Acidimicrobiia bacterium]
MSYRALIFVVSAVAGASGVAMLPAVITASIYQEWNDALLIGIAALVTAGVGFTGQRLSPRPGELSTREGFAAVGLSWFALAAFGTLPYLFTGAIPSVTDAFFESAAGFSTTGSSILADPSTLSHGILFWRSLTQWIGGMGIIVLSIAILPLLGVGGVQLARAESPGPTPDRLTPRFSETAKRLWWLYMAFTLAETLLLWAGEMNLFDAIAHAFTTMSTGGFGTRADSMAGFSAYTQWVVIVFMFLAGVSFALHFRSLRRPMEYVRNGEFRLYAFIAVAVTVVIVVGTLSGDTARSVREGVFVALSTMTTTGFGIVDYNQWSSALQILIVGLMFVGGMAGSTAGGVKTYRLGVLARASQADLRRLIHPKGVFVTRFGKEAVSESIVESVQSFFLLYMFIFMTGTLLFGVFDSLLGADLGIITAATAVASALGNIGPGLDVVGPVGNFASVPVPGKWLLAVLMIVGRLEIFPVVLLFTRELWRR